MENISWGWIIFSWLIGAIIWTWVLYEVIKAASKSKQILEEQEVQTLLLIEIARKLGVEESTLDKIIYEPDDSEQEAVQPN